MLIGSIRPIETRIVETTATSLPELMAEIAAQVPPGWEIDSVPARRIVRRDGVTEIEAEDMEALRARVPEGHQLLTVRRI
ncbi:hypothetical protein J2Y69_002307 [Microbacterium resistens]|uniref:Uncharacterized protein n=1 Tax=Microbacterium resistens TaxID=156977 RepID=A0ABU1SDM0_9MICO|nr:hypothetical protein [Microbacterium resistens]MDR6867703.1 hypothetical protein [Microbacterium resistens]